MLETSLLVLAGGFCGGAARFFVSGRVALRVGETFPWGTFAVNVIGSLLIGLLAGVLQSGGAGFGTQFVRDFLMVGFCGGFTTVSSFSLQTLTLALDGERGPALLNVVLSAVFSLAAVAIGFAAALAMAG